MKGLRWLLGAGLALSPILGCGGAWSDSDTKSATDAVHVQVMVEQICGDDAGCKPSQVRALERASLCANSSMLARHGQAVPDSGVTCQAQ